jgi:hypothetical protein
MLRTIFKRTSKKCTEKFSKGKFFFSNKPVKSENKPTSEEPIPESEPKRFGKTYTEYAKEQQELQKKKHEIEQNVIKSQIVDKTEHFTVQDRSQRPTMDRETKLDIAQFKVSKPEEYYLTGTEKRPEGVFDFSDPTLTMKSGNLRIDGYDHNGFEIGNVHFSNPLVLFSQQIFYWDVYNPEDIRSHNFEIVNLIKPYPGKVEVVNQRVYNCWGGE